MPTIVFFGTEAHDAVVPFYLDRLGFSTWLEQPGCTILRRENQLVGFCERETAETDGMVTVALEDRSAVDDWHARLEDVADGPPASNEVYDIYQFFGTDPGGRTFEVQSFEHELPPVPGE